MKVLKIGIHIAAIEPKIKRVANLGLENFNPLMTVILRVPVASCRYPDNMNIIPTAAA